MRHFYFIYILFFLVVECKAATIKFDDERFSYETTSDKTVKITKYKGSEKSVVFPTSVIYNDIEYKITEIYGSPIFSSSNKTIESFFVPTGIKSLKNIANNVYQLKNIVLEDGTVNIDHLFTISIQNTYTVNFDNITVLSPCEITSNDIISTEAPILVFMAGDIKVYYKGVQNPQIIQMYLYDKYNLNTRPFGETRFNYLLSALQKSGKDIRTIETIDLRSLLSNNTHDQAVQFSFDADKYNPSSELSSGAEVIISETESYANGVKYTIIPDKTDFTAPSTDQPLNISYSRTNTENWNSVCLPFDIKESDFGTNCKIYTVTSASTADNQISLTRVENSETIVEAGTPCFIYSLDEKWNLKYSNVTLSNEVAPKTMDVADNWQVVGSFTNKTIGTGKYKLNSSGTEFGITNNEAATVTAFRCYLNYIGPQGAPNRLSVNIDEEASITLVPNDAEPQKVKLYDLMGRPRKEGSQGIFIKSKR